MKKSTKKFASAGAYRAAVNAGKVVTPKVDPYVNFVAKLASSFGRNTPAEWKAYMNGGEK